VNKFCLLLLCHSHLAMAMMSASIDTDIPINFGNYNPLTATDLETVGRIAVQCSGGAISYAMMLNAGENGSFVTRRMRHLDSYLNYNVYTNSAKTLIWGDGTQGSNIITGRGTCDNATLFQYTVYAKIPALQKNLPAGSYHDSIILTLAY
jgi:spore coat protein U-like protein